MKKSNILNESWIISLRDSNRAIKRAIDERDYTTLRELGYILDDKILESQND